MTEAEAMKKQEQDKAAAAAKAAPVAAPAKADDAKAAKKAPKGIEIKKALVSMVLPSGKQLTAGEPATLTQDEYDDILKNHKGEDVEAKLWEK